MLKDLEPEEVSALREAARMLRSSASGLEGKNVYASLVAEAKQIKWAMDIVKRVAARIKK
jgi:hypothetical protein